MSEGDVVVIDVSVAAGVVVEVLDGAGELVDVMPGKGMEADWANCVNAMPVWIAFSEGG